MTDSLDRLYQQVLSAKDADPSVSRTARLLRAGRGKVAKKMAEEAVEVVIDAMNGDREAVVRESADLLYNLTVLWVASDLRPADVWNEMKRREDLMGIAEKMPKNGPELVTPQGRVAQLAPLPQAPLTDGCRAWTFPARAAKQIRDAEKTL